MTPHIILSATEVDALRRKAIYAYADGIVGQCIAFAAGWLAYANRTTIVEKFK